MSTEVCVNDLALFNSAIAQLRSDKTGVDRQSWVLVGHVDNNANVIDVLSEGENLEDMYALLSDTQVMYGLIRLTTPIDMSITVKFVYFRWIGENVPAVRKGRYGIVMGSTEKLFQPYHMSVEVNSTEDLAEDVLRQKLDESSGARSKVIEGSVQGMQERGFTQHAVKKQEKGFLKSVAPAGTTVEISPELRVALGDVRLDGCATSWVLGTYEDGNIKKPLVLVASGSGDIEELKDSLQDDQVMYGLYRTEDKIDDIATVKFVYIYWIGENVKPMMKGKVYANAGSVEQLWSPTHVSLNVSNRYEITASVIKDKYSSLKHLLSALGGDCKIAKVTSGSGSKSHVK